MEGRDDERFFGAFIEHLAIGDVQVSGYGGRRNLGNFLAALKNVTGFEDLTALGMTRDADFPAPTASPADSAAESALKSVQQALVNVGVPAPSQVWEPIQEDGLKVSIAILPDGISNGDLENLCLRSIEPERLLCADSYIDCLNNTGPQVTDNRLAKTKVFTYLAAGPIQTTQSNETTRRRPGLRLGEAAEAGVWDWSSSAFRQVANFLRDL